MPQMTLAEAQAIVGRVVENPDGPESAAITDRQLAQALATVLVRNALLAAPGPADA